MSWDIALSGIAAAIILDDPYLVITHARIYIAPLAHSIMIRTTHNSHMFRVLFLLTKGTELCGRKVYFAIADIPLFI